MIGCVNVFVVDEVQASTARVSDVQYSQEAIEMRPSSSEIANTTLKGGSETIHLHSHLTGRSYLVDGERSDDLHAADSSLFGCIEAREPTIHVSDAFGHVETIGWLIVIQCASLESVV